MTPTPTPLTRALLAFPNGIALIALGYSLWSTGRWDMTARPAAVRNRSVTTAGAE